MKLTIHERTVLKLLIENSKITDTEIAKEIRITPQAVGKIRGRLEDGGIIKAYSAILDVSKTEIKTCSLIFFDVDNDISEAFEDMLVNSRGILFASKLSVKYSHFCIRLQEDISSFDCFVNDLRLKLGNAIKVKDVFTVSINSIIKDISPDCFLEFVRVKHK